MRLWHGGGRGICTTNYRLYSRDENEKIQSARWLSGADDADILAQIEALNLTAVTEIWDHQRFVAKFPSTLNKSE